MSSKDIGTFRDRFVTLAMLETETGLHRNSLRQRLKVSGVTAFAPQDENYGSVYLRSQVKDILRVK